MQAFIQRRFDDAIKQFDDALSALANDNDDARRRVPILCNRAASYYALDLYKHANRDALEAWRLDESCMRAALLRIRCLVALGKRKLALKAVRKAKVYAATSQDVDALLVEEILYVERTLRKDDNDVTLFSLAHVVRLFNDRNQSIVKKESRKTPIAASSSLSPSSVEKKKKERKVEMELETSQNEELAELIRVAASVVDIDSLPALAVDGDAKRRLESDEPDPVPESMMVAMGAGAADAKRRRDELAHAVATAGSDIDDEAIAEAMRARKAMREVRLVQHGVGDARVDEQIVMGYMYVNGGHYEKGIAWFSSLIEQDGRLVGAYLGRGTALAMSGNLTAARADFSAALRIDAQCDDALKRRGQTLAALGCDTEALVDFERASALAPDHEVFHQRALVHYKRKNYMRALLDFRAALSHDVSSKLSWNHLGLCLNTLGRSDEAIKAHRRAVELDAHFKEAWANMAQANKDLGNFERADKIFARAIEVAPRYVPAYHLRGLARLLAGRHRDALATLDAALRIDAEHVDVLNVAAVVCHGLGLLRRAVELYDTLLRVVGGGGAKQQRRRDPFAGSVEAASCWYQRHVALFWRAHLDAPLDEYNADAALDAHFKEGWCKRKSPAPLLAAGFEPPHSLASVASLDDVDQSPLDKSSAGDALELLARSSHFGERCQLRCAGYLSNRRQHRMFGIAIVDVAQRLARHAFARSAAAAASSSSAAASLLLDGRSSSGPSHGVEHRFGWRDMYDVSVRWRQLSEPNDPVWWVDMLSPEQFEEGYGSHTPMITGQTNVLRYYPMFERSFAIMKQLMREQLSLPASAARALDEATSCADLYELARKDFWVVTPCHSTRTPGRVLEGTRLTLQYVEPEGFEYSIRTPGTPPRWRDYAAELDHVWSLLCDAATAPEPRDQALCVRLVLTLTYYWYNFMPLSRGTAACGLVTLHAMLLALGLEIGVRHLPRGHQPDWEAILCSEPERYVGAMLAWIEPALVNSALVDSSPSVQQTLPTLRHCLSFLNHASTV
jgi:tetratricopeptide (TPR) repeat protein